MSHGVDNADTLHGIGPHVVDTLHGVAPHVVDTLHGVGPHVVDTLLVVATHVVDTIIGVASDDGFTMRVDGATLTDPRCCIRPGVLLA